MKLTNKLAIASLTVGTYLSLALPAFAQESANPCPMGVGAGSLCTTPKFTDLISTIITYLFIFAAIIAIVYLIWGGIKWIMSGGDKAKVEAARGTIIGAIIGLVIVFASYFIISVVLNALFGINISQLELPSLTGNGTPPSAAGPVHEGE